MYVYIILYATTELHFYLSWLNNGLVFYIWSGVKVVYNCEYTQYNLLLLFINLFIKYYFPYKQPFLVYIKIS